MVIENINNLKADLFDRRAKLLGIISHNPMNEKEWEIMEEAGNLLGKVLKQIAIFGGDDGL